MARRLFSTQIVDSDAFLDMSSSTQNLYFHLGMRADDDGFVGNPKKIMRMCGGNEDDLKVLKAKRFILSFESGVVVIKHWLIHNTIRKDRYNPTQYLEEKNLLRIKENKAYTDDLDGGIPIGNQMATNRIPKLSKVKLSQDKLNKEDTTKVVVKTSYGNEDINKITTFLKEKLGVSLDGSQQENRRYAHLLLGKLKKDYPDSPPVELVCQLIEIGLKDDFHSKNITNFKYLYYNCNKIVLSVKGRIDNPKYVKIK